MRDDPAEPHPLRDEVGARVLTRGAGFSDRYGADRLQVGGHLARQKLDEAGAHQRNGVPLARKRGVDGVELRALESLRHEDVGDIVARAALDRIVVAAETGVRIRPAGAAEGRIDAVLDLRWDDRLS